MGTGEQKLTVSAESKGTDQVAKDFGKVAAAQEKVTDKTKESVQSTKAASAAQESLNASDSDYIGILNAINPALGGMVDAMLKGVKVSGDLATQQISLGGAFKKAQAAILGNANALKLLAAGGAVVVGILAIVAALRRMREESEKVTEALKRQKDAANEIKGQWADRQQAIEDVSDARPGGGLSADASRKAAAQAESIGKKFSALSPAAINKAVGLLSDRGFSKDEVTDAAILEQIGAVSLDPSHPTRAQRRILGRARGRNAERIAAFREREQRQGQGLGIRGEFRQEFASELTAGPGGGTRAIEQAVGQFAQPGTDTGRIAELIKEAGTAEALDTAADSPGRMVRSRSNPVSAPQIEAAIARAVLQAFESGAAKINVAKVEVTNNNQNQKHLLPGSVGQSRAIVNGDNLTTEREP